MAHDIYLTMFEVGETRISQLHATGDLKRYIITCIVNMRNSQRVSIQKKYRDREHHELIETAVINDEAREYFIKETLKQPEETLLTLNWSLLSDFEVYFLSKFVEVKNISEMSKKYGINRNTVSEYLNNIKSKLCG